MASDVAAVGEGKGGAAGAGERFSGAVLAPLGIALVGLGIIFAGPPAAQALRAALIAAPVDATETGTVGASRNSGYGIDSFVRTPVGR